MTGVEQHDQLVHVLLQETMGGESPPDLTDRLMRRAFSRSKYRQWGVPACAAALVLVVAGLCVRTWVFRYPAPVASGDYRLDSGALRRGATLTAGPGGASLELGGYAHVQLAPSSRARLGGARNAERIYLQEGQAACKVNRNIGSFDVQTDVGTVSVTGTEFTVRLVENKGDPMIPKRMVVNVMLGTVLVGSAWGSFALSAGQERTLGGSPAAAVLPVVLAADSTSPKPATGAVSTPGAGPGKIYPGGSPDFPPKAQPPIHKDPPGGIWHGPVHGRDHDNIWRSGVVERARIEALRQAALREREALREAALREREALLREREAVTRAKTAEQNEKIKGGLYQLEMALRLREAELRIREAVLREREADLRIREAMLRQTEAAFRILRNRRLDQVVIRGQFTAEEIARLTGLRTNMIRMESQIKDEQKLAPSDKDAVQSALNDACWELWLDKSAADKKGDASQFGKEIAVQPWAIDVLSDASTSGKTAKELLGAVSEMLELKHKLATEGPTQNPAAQQRYNYMLNTLFQPKEAADQAEAQPPAQSAEEAYPTYNSESDLGHDVSAPTTQPVKPTPFQRKGS